MAACLTQCVHNCLDIISERTALWSWTLHLSSCLWQSISPNVFSGWHADVVCMLRQARTIAEGVIAAVALMAQSGLPCYGRGQPIENLRRRFHLEMSDKQAAAFMRATINDAYDKVPALPCCYTASIVFNRVSMSGRCI